MSHLSYMCARLRNHPCLSSTIPLLGYKSRLSRRHLPPQTRMPPRTDGGGGRPAIRVETPTHDLIRIPRTQAPAALLQSTVPERRFQFSPLPSIPGDRSIAPSPASSPGNRAYLGSCRRRPPLVACLASSRLWPFPGFFFFLFSFFQVECRIYSPARTILASAFPVLTRIRVLRGCIYYRFDVLVSSADKNTVSLVKGSISVC